MDIEEISKQIAEARAAHHALSESPDGTVRQLQASSAHIKELNEFLVAAITEGCNPCPNCGNAPHGMFHEGSKAPVEIGCLHCAGKVFKGKDGKVLSPEQHPSFHVRTAGTSSKSPRDVAVERWNAEQWDPLRETALANVATAQAR
jgi:hypothetical protein